MKNILAIDIGTTSVKALILTGKGEIAAEAVCAHSLISLHSGWAEEDPADWEGGVFQALKLLRNQAPDEFAEVGVVGVCGMVPAIVLLDGDGHPVRNSIQQNDARCSGQIEKLKEEINQQKLFNCTGGFTNQQHILPRLLWVKENEPEIWSRVCHIVGSYDYINYILTGEYSLEKNWAVESGAWDIRENCWMTDMLERYGISPGMLPAVHEPYETIGRIRPEVAQMTGLPEAVPVISGSADHVAAALACGLSENGDLLIKFGGAGDILLCTDEMVTDERLFFDIHDLPGKYLLNGCMAASGSLLKWFTEGILKGIASYSRLDAEAEGIAAGSDGLIVLPYFLGEKTPLMDPGARGVFFGLTLAHTRAHIYRAILESVIFGFRHHLDVMKEKGLEPLRVFAADGGAKSPLWCQIAADILDRPVLAFTEGTGSALGTAILAGRSSGILDDSVSLNDLIPEAVRYEPSEENRAAYDRAYEIYRQLYERNKDLMHLC